MSRSAFRDLVRDVRATRHAFVNWMEVGAVGGLAMPSRLPPRGGVGALRSRRLRIATRLGPELETEAVNASPVIAIFRDGEYDLPVPWPELELVVDAGAHIGAFAAWVAVLAPRAHIVAFEPEPGNFRDLERNAARNEFGARTRLVNAAVGASSGVRALAVPAMRDMASTVGSGLPMTTTTVECIDFDRYVREDLGRPIDLLKVDCEGAEWETLDALSTEAWGYIRRIVVETHLVAGHRREQMDELLRRAGFEEPVCLRSGWVNGLGRILLMYAEKADEEPDLDRSGPP